MAVAMTRAARRDPTPRFACPCARSRYPRPADRSKKDVHSRARLPETWTTVTPQIGEDKVEDTTTSAADSSDSMSESTDSDAPRLSA